VVSGFDKRGTNYENVWEHGNIGQFWKGTREQGPPWETLLSLGVSLGSKSPAL